MIRSHFGLQRNPFDPEAITLLAHQQEIFDILRVHAQQGGLCLVLGEPGTGKSILKQALLTHDPKRLITPVVNRTLHTYHNTLRILCEAFQIEFEGRDHHCERLLVQQAFSVHRAGKMLVPIIDDAHLMPTDCLRKLRLLCEDFPRSHCLALLGQPPLLEVVELAANQKPEAALQRLEQMNAVTEGACARPPGDSSPNLYALAADAYLQSVNKGKTALLVSPTWGEIEAVTEQVRNALKAQARLSVTEHSVTALDSLSWTEAQKRNVHQYEAGQKILFLRDGHGFAKNQTVDVVEAGTNALRVKKEDGTTVELNPARLASNSVDVCLARELKVSRGDKLLLQANDRPHRLVNGQIVEVDKIENGQIHLADGRTLPQEYRRFCHGYAVTSHAAQGKTVDDVFLVASSKSFAAVNREQFYVSISRGREHCHVFTDDRELLQRRVGDSRSRAAALDLVKLRCCSGQLA